ncbi:helicase [Treponema denticola]|uniref:Helicase n=1 Tax=Treponema denticola TaxID=158 RepID=A0A9Q9EXP2_TREDN|nr:helicase [Treponema denticola]UTC89474.1 helicase [Treponema denticola]UTD01173.1 helicase [Treponema denticola]
MNPNDVVEWRESIVKLPDHQFFDLIQLYLGKIKTPFNKQRLAEQLSAFLRKPAIQEKIAEGLDSYDILILKAVNEIPNPTQAMLSMFFSKKISYSELSEKLLNAEERLLLYRVQNNAGDKIYKINPILQKIIEPFLSANLFFMPEKIGQVKSKEININDTALAGLYSFCIHNEAVLKNDGSFKKKYEDLIKEVFPWLSEKTKHVDSIFLACESLGLVFRTENGFAVQRAKWGAFSQLSKLERLVYFTAASLFKMRKENLQKLVIILFEFLNSFYPDAYYEEEDVEQFFLLLCMQNFSSVVQNEIGNENILHTSFIGTAELFGILCREKNLIYLNPELFKNAEEPQKPLLIDPSFEVTVLPDSNLKNLLPAAECMEPVLIQTTGKFEITKKACSKIFQSELTSENVYKVLSDAAGHEIPQNIRVSINEWYKNFTSLELYSGFVVSVNKEKEKFFELDTPLKKLVRKKIADGVYLLNVQDLKDFEQAVYKSGLEFIFYKNKPLQSPSVRNFQSLNLFSQKEKKDYTKKLDWVKQQKERENKYSNTLAQLSAILKDLHLTKEDAKAVSSRINRKAIITEEQLKDGVFKFTKKEASGLDFFGKQKIAEQAILGKHILEIELNTENGKEKISGVPEEILKQEKDAVLILACRDLNDKLKISIAHISKIKLIQNSIFSE